MYRISDYHSYLKYYWGYKRLIIVTVWSVWHGPRESIDGKGILLTY